MGLFKRISNAETSVKDVRLVRVLLGLSFILGLALAFFVLKL